MAMDRAWHENYRDVHARPLQKFWVPDKCSTQARQVEPEPRHCMNLAEPPGPQTGQLTNEDAVFHTSCLKLPGQRMLIHCHKSHYKKRHVTNCEGFPQTWRGEVDVLINMFIIIIISMNYCNIYLALHLNAVHVLSAGFSVVK